MTIEWWRCVPMIQVVVAVKFTSSDFRTLSGVIVMEMWWSTSVIVVMTIVKKSIVV